MVGLSQTRRPPGALFQAGILMSLDAGLLARLLRRDGSSPRASPPRPPAWTSCGPGLTAADVTGAVDAAVARRQSVTL